MYQVSNHRFLGSAVQRPARATTRDRAAAARASALSGQLRKTCWRYHFPGSDVDYVYRQGRLLVAEGALSDVLQALGLGTTTDVVRRVARDRVDRERSPRTPPSRTLDFLDGRFNRTWHGQRPQVGPNHLVHISDSVRGQARAALRFVRAAAAVPSPRGADDDSKR
jgi:hypothetical protein